MISYLQVQDCQLGPSSAKMIKTVLITNDNPNRERICKVITDGKLQCFLAMNLFFKEEADLQAIARIHDWLKLNLQLATLWESNTKHQLEKLLEYVL